ncbi:MAG: hypothetical protein LBV43_12815 [Prevotella sp.]|jgi:hypothetical protein|nr:hypothetical protein [Prevotella sp.]
MGRGLAPIVTTLVILTLLFGGWMVARYYGFFYRKTAEDVEMCCNKEMDMLCFQWKDISYSISGFRSVYHRKDVLSLEFNISRGYSHEVNISVDTSQIKFVEIYGKRYNIEDIPICD